MTRTVLASTRLAVTLLLVSGFPRASGPGAGGPYLGQPLPGGAPVLFAPGIVSTGLFERDVAITPDGHEIYWTVGGPGQVYVTTLVCWMDAGFIEKLRLVGHRGASSSTDTPSRANGPSGGRP